jgi:hypothetical protein
MISLPNVSKMSVAEYCDYLESSALYLGIDAHALNRENLFEMGLITNETYERAKWELFKRADGVVYNEEVKALLLETAAYYKRRNKK